MHCLARIITLSLMSMSLLASSQLVTDFAQLIGHDKNSHKAFHRALSGNAPLVIKFYAIGCRPCKATDAGYAKMARTFKDKATFITLDVIKYEEIAKHFNLQSLPSWVILAQKKKIALIKGSKHMGDVAKVLARYLSKKTTS